MKYFNYAIFGMSLVLSSSLFVSCSKSDSASASELLSAARVNYSQGKYNEARMLIDSLRNTYPKEFDVRRAALSFSDSIELAEAKDSLQVADSLEIFTSFQLDDMKQQFVLEKNEKYQSVGYYVVPAHAGNKSKLTFYPEVDETGKFLLVDIDANRKYTFTEVDISANDSISLDNLYKRAPEGQRESIKQCERLASAFLMHKQAKELKEKMHLKVRFFEKKIAEGKKL